MEPWREWENLGGVFMVTGSERRVAHSSKHLTRWLKR